MKKEQLKELRKIRLNIDKLSNDLLEIKMDLLYLVEEIAKDSV